MTPAPQSFVATPAGHWRGVALIAGAACLWSVGGLIVRLIEGAGDFDIVFWRCTVMAATIALWLGLRHRRRAFAELAGGGIDTALVVLFFGAAFVLYVMALNRTSVAHAQIIMATSPAIAALLAWPVLGERVAVRTWIALAATIGGVALMFADSLAGGGWIGDLLAVALAIALGANTVALRRGRRVNMAPAVCIAGVVAALAVAPFAEPFAISGRDFGLLVLMGTMQLGLPLILFTEGVRRLPAAEAGLLTLLETVLAPAWVWIAIGEQPSGLALLGGGAVVAALAWHSISVGRRPASPLGLS